MKVLLISTVSGFVPQFEMNNVKILQELGCEVHYASNYNNPNYGFDNSRLDGTNIIRHQIDFVRSPYNIIKNIKSYIQMNQLMKRYKFDMIHCHTPMGGVIGRLAARKNKISHVMYTAHGFHFYKGGPFIHNTLYYYIEKTLAKVTNTLITINNEDYMNALKFRLRRNGQVHLVYGVGIDSKYDSIEKCENIKEKYGIQPNTFVFTSVGELTKRKNHEYVIHALSYMKEKDFVYLICGKGKLENKLRLLIEELNLQDKVILTGYCTDVKSILNISDAYVFPSLQEGLPVGILEAMSMSLPVVCTNIRGNKDLIDNNGGILVGLDDIEDLVQGLTTLYEDKALCHKLGNYNRNKVKQYEIDVVDKQMTTIYKMALSRCD